MAMDLHPAKDMWCKLAVSLENIIWVDVLANLAIVALGKMTIQCLLHPVVNFRAN